jgi:hypothetical protein
VGIFGTDNAGDLWADAFQLEEKAYETTYCDGTQEGCEWNGAVHASTSARSALSRAGGRVRPLTDYFFEISRMDGTGMPPQELGLQQYSILPGGEMTSVREGSLPFTLTGAITDTVGIGFDGLDDVHAAREALIALLRPNAYPYVDGDPQPVRFRYTGAATEKEIAAHYEAGLELRINGRFPCWERVAFRFIADDPFWKEIGNEAAVLDTEDTATFRYVAGRLRATGQWDDLGLAANPTTGGIVRTILTASDGYVYIGGTFTGWNGVAGRDYVARYDPQTDTWATVGGGGDFAGSTIHVLIEGPDGTIYAGGNFTNVAGDGNADYIAQWNGVAWSAVSGGGTAFVYDLAFDGDGLLWIVGGFANWNAIANADSIVTWNGAAYAAPAVGANSIVYQVRASPNGGVYIFGGFTTVGGVNANRIAYWDGSSYNTVSDDTLNNNALSGAIANSGDIYAGGNFTDASSNVNADRIAFTLGGIWEAMSTGANAQVESIEIAPDLQVYAGGDFTTIGGISNADYGAKWNGSSWSKLDVNLPGAAFVQAFAFGNADPVITHNYDRYVGFVTTGAATFAGSVSVTNNGTAEAYPIFTVTRSGGTSANFSSIRNETLGLELLFDYDLQDGETLTIDLAPENKSVVSSFSGEVPGAVLPNSDFGTWRLNPGTNQVTSFVDVVGAPTITATMEWRTQWAGCDD